MHITLRVFGAVTTLVAVLVLGIEFFGSVAADNAPPGRLSMLLDSGTARERTLAIAKTALASQGSGRQAQIGEARDTIAEYLGLKPTDGELWTVQAQLAAASKSKDQEIAELLKMSYFMAPNDLPLMPQRIDVAVRTRALADPVLETLAAGDIRAILTKRKDLTDRLVESYRGASDVGKASLKRLADSVDPQFGARLNAQR